MFSLLCGADMGILCAINAAQNIREACSFMKAGDNFTLVWFTCGKMDKVGRMTGQGSRYCSDTT